MGKPMRDVRLRAREGAVRLALAAPLLLTLVEPRVAQAAELVQGVRSKLSAADLLSAEAAVEEYRLTKGADREYLTAVGWLARGAEMLGRRDKAAAYVADLRREIREETSEVIIPLGAAIEVEGKLRLAAEGRGAAVRFLEGEAARAKDPALRSRIYKNLNNLTLEGEKAPAIAGKEAGVAGRPTLLFFWAHWCGDCKAEAAKLGRIKERFASKGLAIVAPTRLYGTVAENKAATPAEESAHIAKVFGETYPGLAGVSVPVDTETMIRYGASATPTYALLDKAGRVRLYTPTRVSEAELSRRIEALLAE